MSLRTKPPPIVQSNVQIVNSNSMDKGIHVILYCHMAKVSHGQYYIFNIYIVYRVCNIATVVVQVLYRHICHNIIFMIVFKQHFN